MTPVDKAAQQVLALLKHWLKWIAAPYNPSPCFACGENYPNHRPDCMHLATKEPVEDKQSNNQQVFL